jgi:Phospholipase_D-nuclease N-terminal/Short C-terminal domain
MSQENVIGAAADIGSPPTNDDLGGQQMLIAEADFPFLEFLWAMIVFFAWVIYIWIVITVLVDLFRRHDIGGWGKAGWVVFVIVLPFLGVLIYLIAQHDGMRERSTKEVKAQQQEFDQYVREAAGGSAAEIAKAKELLDAGTISQAEFDAIKAKAVS